MNVSQMSRIKRWQLEHRREAPLEYHAWDMMLTLWVLGWMGVAPALLLHWTWMVAACVPAFFAPSMYVRLRERLHDSGRLRCDWLPALA